MNKNNYLKLLLIAVVVLIVSFTIWKYIDNRNKSIASAASSIYTKMMLSHEKQQADQVLAQATELVSNKKYTATPYSTLASLMLAKLAVDNRDLDKALEHLNAAVATAKDNLQHIARIRLSRVLTAKSQYDKALQVLEHKAPKSFKTIYLIARGDVYAASGDITQARQAYIDAENSNSAKMPLLDLKLSELSGRSGQ